MEMEQSEREALIIEAIVSSDYVDLSTPEIQSETGLYRNQVIRTVKKSDSLQRSRCPGEQLAMYEISFSRHKE